MTAKRSTTPDDAPAGPCLTDTQLDQVGDAVARKRVFDPERTQLTMRLGLIVSSISFIVYATTAISGFMRDMHHFEQSATAQLTTTGKRLSDMRTTLDTVVARQNNVIADRWKFSDQQPWTYQLEKANRELLREGGGKGLVVPEPTIRPTPQP